MLFQPSAPHYDLPGTRFQELPAPAPRRHLLRDNAPRLGPLQDDEALLLYGLVRALRPRTVVEFGTAHGFSALNFLQALFDDQEARVFSAFGGRSLQEKPLSIVKIW